MEHWETLKGISGVMEVNESMCQRVLLCAVRGYAIHQTKA